MIRDHDGDMVSAGRGKLNHICDPFHGELIACVIGVREAVRLELVTLLWRRMQPLEFSV